jgi:hypothetical protein
MLKPLAVASTVRALEYSSVTNFNSLSLNIDPDPFLPTTDQIEGRANTHGHDEECRQAK